jgi:hypothetical protein
MENSSSKRACSVGTALTLLLAVLASGCHNDPADAVPKADPKATWAFWQTIQDPLPRNTLYHRIDGFNAETAGSQELQTMGSLFRQMASDCRGKASQIASAPVAGVDVDAANYGVKRAQLLAEYAKAFEKMAQLIDKESDLTSGETWLFDFFFALGRHAGEGDEAWGNALKEELVDKAKTFGDLQIDGQGVSTFIPNLQETASNLQTVEMQTRIALARRYGREFPTSSALASQKPAPAAEVFSQAKLTSMRQELMDNLIGRKIKTAAGGNWTFADEEFQTFRLVNGTNYGDVVDFELMTHVKGRHTGAEHDFRLLLTYRKSKDAFALIFVKPL